MRRIGFFFALVACDSINAPTNPGAGSLRLCVRDPAGDPLPGAEVWVQGDYAARQNTTDDGQVALANVPAGPTTLIVRTSSLGATFTTEVLSNYTREPPCVTAHPLTCIGGQFRLPSGALAPPMEVLWEDTPLWTWSRADGHFELMVPAGGTYQLHAQAINMFDKTWVMSALPNQPPGCGKDGLQVMVESTPTAEPRIQMLLPELPQAVSDPALALDGTTLYAAGGNTCELERCGCEPDNCSAFNNYTTQVFQIFDFSTLRWTLGPQLPGRRGGASAGILASQLYVVGGYEAWVQSPTETYPLPEGESCWTGRVNRCRAHFPKDIFIYDPAANTWNLGPERLNIKDGAGWTQIIQGDNTLYLVGGVSNTYVGYTAQIRYLSENTQLGWQTLAGGLVSETYFAKACLIDDQIFTFGGESWVTGALISAHNCSRVVQSFDRGSGSWNRQHAPIPFAEGKLTGTCVVNGQFIYSMVPLCTGGRLLSYHPTTNTWAKEDFYHVPEALGRAVATPHGLVHVGAENYADKSNRRVFALIGARFQSRYSANLTRILTEPLEPRVCEPVEPVEDGASSLEVLNGCWPYKGCLEPCRNDAECAPGHTCGQVNYLTYPVCRPAACDLCSAAMPFCQPQNVVAGEIFGRIQNTCISTAGDCVPTRP